MWERGGGGGGGGNGDPDRLARPLALGGGGGEREEGREGGREEEAAASMAVRIHSLLSFSRRRETSAKMRALSSSYLNGGREGRREGGA